MQLALLFTGAERLADTLAIGRAAEAAGFASLYMVEAYRSAWVPLAALAAATTRVTLGPYVANVYARSPMLAAMTAADFQELSGGRLHLGLGGGNRIINEQWQGIPHARVLTKVRETVDILRRAAATPAGATLDYAGQVHRMRWSPHGGPLPPSDLGRRDLSAMLRTAAACADGIAGARPLPAYLRGGPAAGRRRARRGRRSPAAALAWRAVLFAAVGADRAVTRARRAVRSALFAPLLASYYEYTMSEQGYAAVVARLKTLVPNGRLEAAIDAIPDDMVQRFALCGTLEECRARLAEYDGLLDEVLLSNALPLTDTGWQPAYADLLRLGNAA